MERLGDDELTLIFNRIHNSKDRKSFFQVSKQFMRVACIRLIKLDNLYPDMLYDILPASPNLVRFYNDKPLSNSFMKFLAHSCPKLRYLMLYSWTSELFDFDDDGFSAIANACCYLVEVNISGSLHIGDVGIHSLISSCKHLEFLTLNRCVKVTDQSLEAIAESTRLKQLNLRGCYLITDLGLKYIANGNVKNCLIYLDLGECDMISDNGIIYLKQMVNLSIVNLSKCNRISANGIISLKQMADVFVWKSI